MKHVPRIAAITALVTGCTFLPFLPGRYDAMAVPLSAMAQIIGTVGLVLVPVGGIWLLAERSQRFAARRHLFRLAAGVTCSLVGAVVALAAIVQSGFALAATALALWAYVMYRSAGAHAASSAFPFYLIVIPIVVALLQLALVERAVTFSRNTAIRNSEPLIAAIEQFRRTQGHYPASLFSVNPDYWPGVIGIPKYFYERNGGSYNLFFEQFTHHLGVREFVMYNPRDEHAMTSHARDILELTPAQLALDRTRGHNTLHNTRHAHWKYFWFD